MSGMGEAIGRSAAWAALAVAAAACAPNAGASDAAPYPAPSTTTGSLAAETVTTSGAAPTTATTTRPSTATGTATSTITPTTLSTATATATATAAPSTSTMVPPRPEAARRRPADELRAPDGDEIHEPSEPWLGDAAFTGLTIGPATAARPGLAVKIDNAPGGRPPWNLADADLVFEENVEGITRFIAVYHSSTPDRVGPVRSARESDLDVLAGLNRPILAWSGGNPGVTDLVRDAHRNGWLANLSALSTSCFWRSATRDAPHNLLLDPACAWESRTHAGPARPAFPRDAGGPPDGRSQRRFDVVMDGVVIEWVWDGATERFHRRQNGAWHRDVDGEQVAAANVVQLRVEYVPSTIDARSPQALTVGSGRAVVHRGGRVVTGTWERVDRFAPFTLLKDDGTPLTLAPGPTFVELER